MGANNSWYRVGQVTTTQNSTTVSGFSTWWLTPSPQISQGDMFSLDGVNWYEVATVGGDATLTLRTPFLQAGAQNSSYVIVRNWTVTSVADLSARLAGILAQNQQFYDGPYLGRYPDGTAAAPGLTFLSDTASGIKRTANGGNPNVTASIDFVIAGATVASITPSGLSFSGGTGFAALTVSSGLTVTGGITSDTLHLTTPLPIASGGTGAATAAAALTALGAQGTAQKGVASGYAGLDSSGFVPAAQMSAANLMTSLTSVLGANSGLATLDSTGKLSTAQIPASLTGAVVYQGTWNATTNTPTIAAASSANKGWYYKVSVAGTTTVNGISQWNIGDTIISDGTAWDKIDGIANEVVSINGQTGAVTLTTTNIAEGTNLYFTTARAQAAISVSGSLSYAGGIISYTTPVPSVAGRTGAITLTYADIGGLATVAHTGAMSDLGSFVVASGTTLGTVKVGSGLAIDGSGVLSAAVTSVASKTGAVSLVYSDISGLSTVAHTGSYTDLSNIPTTFSPVIATASVVGGVKQGSTVSIAGDGTLSISNANVLSALGFTPVSTLVLGQALGVATLDSGGKVLTAQLPASVTGTIAYQGTWNASTNTPTLTSGSGTQGHYYIVSVAGTTSLDGVASWNVGDQAIFDGTVWEKILDAEGSIISVNGKTGTVVLAVADISGAAALAGAAFTGTTTVPTVSSGDNSNNAASTAFVHTAIAGITSGVSSFNTRTGAITLTSSDVTGALGFTPANAANLGLASGIATLDGSGKLSSSQIPTSLVGALQYQGTWNATTNSPALATGTGTKGQYYVVATAGTTTIDGVSSWAIGDWLAFDGTKWDKIDGPNSGGGGGSVVTVFGRSGAVVAANGDYSVSQVTGAAPIASPTFTGTVTMPSVTFNSSTGITFSDGTTYKGPGAQTIDTVPSGATYTLQLSDRGKTLLSSGAGQAVTVSVPTGLRVAGAVYGFENTQYAMTVNLPSGDTLIAPNGAGTLSTFTLANVGDRIEVMYIGGTTWITTSASEGALSIPVVFTNSVAVGITNTPVFPSSGTVQLILGGAVGTINGNGQAQIRPGLTFGLILTGHGSTDDVLISGSGGSVFVIPSGTTVGSFPGTGITTAGYGAVTGTTLPTATVGTLGLGGILSGAPTLAGSGEGAVFLTASNGISLQGSGSTNDLSLRNNAGTVVAAIATGSTAFSVPNLLTVSNSATAAFTAGKVTIGGGLSAGAVAGSGQLTVDSGNGLSLTGLGSLASVSLCYLNTPVLIVGANSAPYFVQLSGALLLNSGSAPTGTLLLGTSLQFDSTQIAVSAGMGQAGQTGSSGTLYEWLSGCFYSATANVVTPSNTSSNSLLSSSKVGTLVIPPNVLVPGKTIRIGLYGVFTTLASGQGTATLSMTLTSSAHGAITVGTGPGVTPVASQSGVTWNTVIMLTCQASGTSGKVVVSCNASPGGAGAWPAVLGAAQTTIDTTVAQTIDVKYVNSASGGCILTVNSAIGEVIA